MKTLSETESNAIGKQILEAMEWVYDQADSDDPHDDPAWDAALRRAFQVLYCREPTDDDEQAGLWSLCCAACPNCGTRPKYEVGEEIGVAKI